MHKVATLGTTVSTSAACSRQSCTFYIRPSTSGRHPRRPSFADLRHENYHSCLIRRKSLAFPAHSPVESLQDLVDKNALVNGKSVAPLQASPIQVPRPTLRLAQLFATGVAYASVLACVEPALAIQIRPEPANALSIPTWAVHVSSVIEWVTAMVLFWRLAEVSGTRHALGFFNLEVYVTRA
jgi:hypothetical protein